ncbi:hypothetical protein ACJX0J_017362, partial [Zea mays]
MFIVNLISEQTMHFMFNKIDLYLLPNYDRSIGCIVRVLQIIYINIHGIFSIKQKMPWKHTPYGHFELKNGIPLKTATYFLIKFLVEILILKFMVKFMYKGMNVFLWAELTFKYI